MKTRVKASVSSQPQYVSIAGRAMVVLEQAEYERLRRDADTWEPALPPQDADGNYPAKEAMAVTMARDILRDRRRLGLSQEELANRARIRRETLDQIEHATGGLSVRTIDKIDRALKAAERRIVKQATR